MNPFGNRLRPFPKWESLKNKSGIRGKFLRPEKCQPIHHKSPRFHHKFTTKKPRFTTRFFKNPLQKLEKLHQKKIAQLKPFRTLSWLGSRTSSAMCSCVSLRVV